MSEDKTKALREENKKHNEKITVKESPEPERASKRIETPATKDLPPKDELVTLSREELKNIIQDTIEETNRALREAPYEEKLALVLDRDEKVRYLESQGETHIEKHSVKVKQSRPMGPIDQHGRMERTAKEAGAIPKGSRTRWVNTSNSELNSLRRSQGYKPVLVEDHEVRYADSVLMAMPAKQYEEEVQKPKQERRENYNRLRGGEAFKAAADTSGVETFGEGIQYDRKFEAELEAERAKKE